MLQKILTLMKYKYYLRDTTSPRNLEKDKKSKIVTKQQDSRFFLLFLHDDRRIRIQEVQKHIPLTSGSGSGRPKKHVDPDPEHCFKVIKVFGDRGGGGGGGAAPTVAHQIREEDLLEALHLLLRGEVHRSRHLLYQVQLACLYKNNNKLNIIKIDQKLFEIHGKCRLSSLINGAAEG